MSHLQFLIICIALVAVGALASEFLNVPLKVAIEFLSSIGGALGGVCALLALFIWKKQTNYNKALEVLETVEQVHSICSSMSMQAAALILLFNDKSEDDDCAESYMVIIDRYNDLAIRAKVLNSSFLVKSRIFEAINKDKNVNYFRNNIVSCTNMFTSTNFPNTLDKNNETIILGIANQIFTDYDNRNNQVVSEFRNYLHKYLGVGN